MTPLSAERPSRFRVEADMLAPLAASAGLLAPSSSLVLFEVACAAGVPDVVLMDLDRGELSRRGGAGPVTDPVGVRVLVAMATKRPPAWSDCWSPAELALLAGVSERHLRRTVLPRLRAAGHVVAATCGLWAPAYPYRSLARRLVTVEAKLRNWRGGVAQASRHAAVADAAWVALDARSVGSALAGPEWFSAYGVGLASVSSCGLVELLIAPGASRSRQPGRELLAERAAELHLSGQVSGPLPSVFGQELVASTGVDPRRLGAVAG